MEGYIYIVIASILFSSQFAFNKQFQRLAGKDFRAIFLGYAVGPLPFILITLCTEGFHLKVTPFSLCLSLYSVTSTFIMGYCGVKALASGSLSNYSIFMMSGGMILPCLYGAINGEPFGVFKIIGTLSILAAVFVKINFKEKAAWKTYVHLMILFVLNGMAGVVASIYRGAYDAAPSVHPSPTQYALGNSMFTMTIGCIAFVVYFLYTLKKQKQAEGDLYNPSQVRTQLLGYAKATPWSMGGGLVNNIGNLLLLFALKTVDTSLQYPIITGGSIFLSAVIGLLFFKEKPDKRTWFAVALAVIGTIVILF